MTANLPSRPETIDAAGVRHRYGCDLPEPVAVRSSIPGWVFHRCPTCGAARLVRGTGACQ